MSVERHFVEPRSPEWFALRAKDLTMSEIGAVAGVDPFATAYEIWARKAGLSAPPEENAAMTLGRWCEPAVCCALEEKHPEYEITYPLDRYYRDPVHRIGGTPDARGYEQPSRKRVAFEFKVISRQSYERSWSGGPPLGYQLQTLGNAMLLDADHGILAALVLGWQDAELVIHRVDRNAAAEAGIRSIAARFWQAFDEGHAIAGPDYARDGDVIRQVFRPNAEKPAPIDLTGDNRIGFLAEEWQRLTAQESAARKDKETVKAEIIHKLDGAEAAIADGWKITNKMQHRDAHLQPAADFPRLLISRQKEKAA
jgi:hypothetical protein